MFAFSSKQGVKSVAVQELTQSPKGDVEDLSDGEDDTDTANDKAYVFVHLDLQGNADNTLVQYIRYIGRCCTSRGSCT